MYACTTCKPKPRCFLTPPIAIRLSPPAHYVSARECRSPATSLFRGGVWDSCLRSEGGPSIVSS